MGIGINGKITLEKLGFKVWEKDGKKVIGAKLSDIKGVYPGAKGTYVDLTVWTKDEADQYGNNVSFQVSQSKEEREQNKDVVYLGNGKVFYNAGSTEKPKDNTPVVNPFEEGADDLPF